MISGFCLLKPIMIDDMSLLDDQHIVCVHGVSQFTDRVITPEQDHEPSIALDWFFKFSDD